MPDEEREALCSVPECEDYDDEADEYERQSKVYDEARRRSKLVDDEYGEDAMPNLSLPKRMSIVAPDFVDEEEMSPMHKKLVRRSLLAPEVIRAMSAEEVKKELEPSNYFNQICLFGVSIALMGLSPLVETMALWDPISQTKKVLHIASTPNLCSYVISTVGIVIYTVSFKSQDNLKEIFSVKAFAMTLPMAIAFCFGDWAGAQAQAQLNGPMWKVLGQTKLIIVAFISWLVLKRTQTFTQWSLLIAISLLVAAYGLKDLKNLQINSWPMVFAGMGAIILACGAGVLSEVLFKKNKASFSIQMGQNRFCCGIVSVIFTLMQLVFADRWRDFPFGGWTKWTCVLVLTDLGRSWTSCALVKRLDSVWKSLGMAMSLGITYLATAMLFSGPMGIVFDWSQFALVCAVSLAVLSYAGSKQEEQKILQLQADAKRREPESAA